MLFYKFHSISAACKNFVLMISKVKSNLVKNKQKVLLDPENSTIAISWLKMVSGCCDLIDGNWAFSFFSSLVVALLFR